MICDDLSLLKCEEDPDPSIEWSPIGGELYFTQHNLKVKPKAGTLVTFPGTDEYLHGVANVLPGKTRYVISTFAFSKD